MFSSSLGERLPNMKRLTRLLTLPVLALALSGCSSEFADWHQELDYLHRQATTTPKQYKRLLELEAKLNQERAAENKRLETKRRAKAEFEAATNVDQVYNHLVTEDNRNPPAQRKTLEELRQQAKEQVRARLAD
jgi:hypothetical protein